jgi:hypothetical protein
MVKRAKTEAAACPDLDAVGVEFLNADRTLGERRIEYNL